MKIADHRLLATGLSKEDRHICYWIEDGMLYECYRVISGVRNRFILNVPSMEDTEACSRSEIEYIEQDFLNGC